MPVEYTQSVRIGVADRVYSFPSLPFGWNSSPALAQQMLAMYVVEAFTGQVAVVPYMDDILIMGVEKWTVGEQASSLVLVMVAAGWIINPKSVVEP